MHKYESKNDKSTDFIWFLTNNFYQKLKISSTTKFQNHQLQNMIKSFFYEMLNSFVKYNSQIYIIIYSEKNEELKFRNYEVFTSYYKDIFNNLLFYKNNDKKDKKNIYEAPVLYTLVLKRNFTFRDDSEQEFSIEEIFFRFRKIYKKNKLKAVHYLCNTL